MADSSGLMAVNRKIRSQPTTFSISQDLVKERGANCSGGLGTNCGGAMARPRGKWLPVSPVRRLVVDLMAISRDIPTVVAERRMRLASLADARRVLPGRPSWSAVFLQAFGAVAARRPVLRRSYMSFPRPHYYEHPISIASFTVERDYAGEEAVFVAQVRQPETKSLTELDGIIRQFKEKPVERIGSFRRALRLSRTPWPLRPLLWRLAFHGAGRFRARFLGTFGLTTVGSLGAGLARVVTPLTTNLHFGVLDGRGDMDVRLSFDHRVLDGAAAARALADLEDVLLTETLAELHNPSAHAHTATAAELHCTPSSTSVTS
jgi:hypothetical protein